MPKPKVAGWVSDIGAAGVVLHRVSGEMVVKVMVVGDALKSCGVVALRLYVVGAWVWREKRVGVGGWMGIGDGLRRAY